MAKHLVTIGDLVLDIIMPVTFPIRGGGHQSTAECHTEPGGAANFILTARNLGLDVSAAGTVGAVTYGENILRPLREKGVDVSNIVTMPGSTSTLVVTLTDRKSGEHVFIGHYGEGPDITYPKGLDACIARADAIFVEGYTLAEKRVTPMALRALDHAHKLGKPIYTDVGPLLNQVDSEHVKWLLERTYVLFLTEDEAPLVAKGKTSEKAYAHLLNLGPKYAVVKSGPRGCTILTTDWWYQSPAFKVERVVDTVGAGDCFDAAFVAATLNGLDMEQCATFANAAGSASTQKVGAGTNAPTCAEVMAVLEKAGEKIDYPCSK